MRGEVVKRWSLLVFLLVAAPAWAQESEEPIPTPEPRRMSQATDLKTALDECKTHPSVVNAGTPLELCVEPYGFIRQDGAWVRKPATR
jgi:hypothetical protein